MVFVFSHRRLFILDRMKAVTFLVFVVFLNVAASTRNLKITTKGPLCGRGDASPCSCQCRSKEKSVTLYNDCTDVGDGKSGVYTIQPFGSEEGFDVYCDMDTDGGGWTVFQRRQDGSEDFYRGWADYEKGFGSLTGEFWLGNLKIHNISRNSPHELWIDLADFENNTAFAKYSEFSLGDISTNYRLDVSGYSGTAGDAMEKQNKQSFSTLDKDNDAASPSCAVVYKGAWWYNHCHDSNLNGQYLRGDHSSYADGVNWNQWKGYYYSLKTTEIKIRKIA